MSVLSQPRLWLIVDLALVLVGGFGGYFLVAGAKSSRAVTASTISPTTVTLPAATATASSATTASTTEPPAPLAC